MMPEIVSEILFIVVLILFNGLFAMAEIALISSRKARLQSQAEQGILGARAALRLLETPTQLLSTVQIGISLVGVLSGAIGGATLSRHLAGILVKIDWLAPYSQTIALVLVVALITYASLVFGELIPKRLALVNPESIAVRSSRLMEFLARISNPLVRLLSASTDLGLRLLGVSANMAQDVTEEEVKVMIDQGTHSGVFEEVEQNMLESVFRLSDRTVEHMMTPRTEITWLDVDDADDEILKQVTESNLSRYPVAQGSLDNVLGVLQVRKLLAQSIANRAVDLRSLLDAPLFLPESTPAFKALADLKKGEVHVALVLDEYGGVSGMVTLFDILESIVGEISSERGQLSEPQVIRRPDGSLLLDGLIKIDVLKDLLDLKELPNEDHIGYQTLGGMVMSQLGDIPISGQTFEWDGLSFEVVDMDERRVDKVLVQRIHQ